VLSVADMARQDAVPQPASTEPTLGPKLAELGGIRAIVRSQRVASHIAATVAKRDAGNHRLGNVSDQALQFVRSAAPTTPRPSIGPHARIGRLRCEGLVARTGQHDACDLPVIARKLERLDQFSAFGARKAL